MVAKHLLSINFTWIAPFIPFGLGKVTLYPMSPIFCICKMGFHLQLWQEPAEMGLLCVNTEQLARHLIGVLWS